MIRVEVVADKLNASEREEDKASLTALYRSLKEKLAGMEAQAKAIDCDEVFITIDTREPVIIPAGWRKCIYCGKCVRTCPTDAWQGDSGFVISFGGLYGNRIAVGKNFLPIIFDENTLYKIVDMTLKFFETNAKPGERFRNTLDRVGWDKFIDEVKVVANAG